VSRENVEVAKRVFDAYNERDVSEYDQLLTPDFEWITAMAGIENEVLRGREGIEKYFANLDNAREELRLMGREFRDVGDRVLWLAQMEGTGRGSGAPVISPAASLHDFQSGLISRTRSFIDHGEAFRAAGLED
jgi:ketosteroid isomerase-like protein